MFDDSEIMHAMWKPQKFKAIYLLATLYVLTLTLPSAAAVYWAFGDALLNHSNAFSLLPRSPFRDMAVILMLIHQACIHLFVKRFTCFYCHSFFFELIFNHVYFIGVTTFINFSTTRFIHFYQT